METLPLAAPAPVDVILLKAGPDNEGVDPLGCPRELVGGKPETPPVHSARRRACKDELRKVGTTCVLAQSCAEGAQSLRAHSEEAVLRNADLWRHLQARPRPRAPALPAGFTLLDVLSVADDHPVEGPVAPHLPRKALGGGCAALSAATSHAPLTSLATCVLCPLKVQRRPLPTRRLALWWLKPASRAHRRWVSHPASSTRNTSRREHPRTDGRVVAETRPREIHHARLSPCICVRASHSPGCTPPRRRPLCASTAPSERGAPVRAANSARLQLRAPPTPRASFPPPGPDLNAHSRPEIISDLWAPWSANRAWRPQCAPPTPRASNSARRQLRAPPTPRASNSARLQLRAPPTPRASFPPPGPDLNAHSRPEIISDLWAPWSANRTPAESPRSCVRAAALLASAPGLPAEHRQVTPVLSAAALAWFRPRPSVSSGPSGSSLSLGSRLVRRHLFLPSARTLHRPRVPFVPPAITTAIRIIDATSPPRLGNIDSLENQCSDTGRTRPCDHLQSPRTHRISDHKPHSVKSPKAPKSPAGASADRSHECLHESGVRSYGQR
ncbi:hypothetical protein B0H10DRAFT_2207939 [Mycena sp. CBHHK59/15]|nr:hypothetical protein B0H10DRAFT_2207939 [Mycena sp. CBHHK59/15]